MIAPDQGPPYLLAYNARLKKHVVIDTATEEVAAAFDTWAEAKAECDRLTECWLRTTPGCTGMTPPDGVLS